MKNFSYQAIILVTGIFMHTPLGAENLITIYREALEHDAEYKIARHTYIASQERLTQGRARLLPSIDFTGRARNVYLDTDRLDGDILIRNRGMIITAVQPLFRIENIIIYQQSKKEVAQGDAQFVLAAQNLILRITQAYFDMLTAQANVEVLESQTKAFERQLEQMRYNLESGLGTIVDLDEAESRYDLAISQEIVARNTLEISRHNLQRIINRFPEMRPDINMDKIVSGPLALPDGSMDEWVSLAEQKNIALRVQQFTYDIARQEANRAKSEHYPTLDLVGQYNNQIDNPFVVSGRGQDFESKAIGIELRVPIFHGFSTQSKAREMLANRDKAREEVENSRRLIALQVKQHYLNLTNGVAQVRALRRALKSSQSQLDSTILGQEAGIRIEIDVLNAQQQYYSARRDLAIAYYNYLMARLRLKADVAELDESTLEEINALL